MLEFGLATEPPEVLEAMRPCHIKEGNTLLEAEVRKKGNNPSLPC